MKQWISSLFIVVSLFFSNAQADSRFGVVLISKGKVKITSTSGAEKNGAIGLDVFEGEKLTTGP